jgi:uncharacterized protein (TIGR03067 family)
MDADLQQLQGIWQALRVETGAGPVPAEVAQRLRYRFESGRVTLLEGEQVTGPGTVIVHSAATPKAIDVEMTEGQGRGQVARGIYEIVGGRLRLCIGPERPAGFIPAGQDSLVELERTPIGPEPP